MSHHKKFRANQFENFTNAAPPTDENLIKAQWQQNHTANDSTLLGRRELLKALAAVAGAGAMLSLPTRWDTPVIEMGTLPAHAQSSEVIGGPSSPTTTSAPTTTTSAPTTTTSAPTTTTTPIP